MSKELVGAIGVIIGLGLPLSFLSRILWLQYFTEEKVTPKYSIETVIIEDIHEHAPYWQIIQDQLIKQARTGTEQEKTAAKSELRRLNPYLNI